MPIPRAMPYAHDASLGESTLSARYFENLFCIHYFNGFMLNFSCPSN